MTETESALHMHKELFGVFGDRSAFERERSPETFDRVVEGPTITAGVRNSELGIPGRTTVFQTPRGVCVLWGEVYPRQVDGMGLAQWVLQEYAKRGPDVLNELNGSYLAILDHERRDGLIATDCVRSRECYFSDATGTRLFGTDPSTVGKTVPDPTLAEEPLQELLHFGVVLDDRTAIAELQRIPFDSGLTAAETRRFDRFVYEPREFDYASELAERLERALSRRRGLPGRNGLLLSGGYDSRVALAGIPDIEAAFTVAKPGSSELAAARRIASQYGASHTQLHVDDRYLNTDAETVRYGHGIMESLHIHHAGYTDQMDVETIFHGGLADSLLRGHFLPISGIQLFDHECPPYSLDTDPDVGTFLTEIFGYLPASESLARTGVSTDESGTEFLQRRVAEVSAKYDARFDRKANEMALLGIQNQPSRSFRYHLGDNFIESCFVLDRELIEWHLATPPEHRNTKTFIRAMRKLDGDILRHRPPDRATDSYTLNQIGNFLQRVIPLVSGYEGPWPDRKELYEDRNLDEELFGDHPAIQELPWRLKLRINDINTWLDATLGQSPVDSSALVRSNPVQQPTS
ncbi:asparagine synthase-related protein [Halorientalis salina]|uniref:asparagine synthase-related protein n=1 Tax=Halorientalis salina TaxID=2932266 RepID=UPI0010ABBBFE|nr:asparagine synthase-related protein [Halorientalis salina]